MAKSKTHRPVPLSLMSARALESHIAIMGERLSVLTARRDNWSSSANGGRPAKDIRGDRNSLIKQLEDEIRTSRRRLAAMKDRTNPRLEIHP
jgi:hypothetical protein